MYVRLRWMTTGLHGYSGVFVFVAVGFLLVLKSKAVRVRLVILLCYAGRWDVCVFATARGRLKFRVWMLSAYVWANGFRLQKVTDVDGDAGALMKWQRGMETENENNGGADLSIDQGSRTISGRGCFSWIHMSWGVRVAVIEWPGWPRLKRPAATTLREKAHMETTTHICTVRSRNEAHWAKMKIDVTLVSNYVSRRTTATAASEGAVSLSRASHQCRLRRHVIGCGSVGNAGDIAE